MNLVDNQTEAFGRREGVNKGRRSAPKSDWVDNQTYRHVTKLLSDGSKKDAAKHGVEAALGAIAERERVTKAAGEKQAAQHKTDIRELTSKVDRAAKRAARDGENSGQELKTNKKKKPPATPPKPKQEPPEAGVGPWDGKSRSYQEKHLMNTVGRKDNKNPCMFFHTASKECERSAEECRFHHIV
jgi:hypothetical protein